MLFIDFDGTIIDLWPRFHAVFSDIIGISEITLEEYKRVKQTLLKDDLVARYFGLELPTDYYEKKRMFLEDPEYLDMDRCVIPLDTINQTLANGARILTKRRNAESFVQELKQLGITPLYHLISRGDKASWIKSNYSQQKAIIIGDSLLDLEVALNPNVDAYMVGYGLNTIDQFTQTGISFTYLASPDEVNDFILNWEAHDAI